MWPFALQCKEVKLNKMQNSAPQPHQPLFKSLVTGAGGSRAEQHGQEVSILQSSVGQRCSMLSRFMGVRLRVRGGAAEWAPPAGTEGSPLPSCGRRRRASCEE